MSKQQHPRKKMKKIIEGLLKEASDLQKRLPEIEQIAEEKISVAKSRLMQVEPFFAMLLFKLPTFPCYQIETMSTDGLMLLYNPIFVSDKLLRKDVLFVLLHEICHIFFKHNVRGPIKARDAEKVLKKQSLNKDKKDKALDKEVARIKHVMKEWNFATDYAINNHIREHLNLSFSKELEKMMLYDEKYKNMTSEQIYDKIKTDPQSDGGKGNGKGKGDGEINMGIGGVLPLGIGSLTDQEIKQLEKEFEQDVQSAAITAKRAGHLPKGVENVIESLYKTTTPWQDVFRTIFTSISKQDYTFRYPNKRYTQHMVDWGVIMPSLWGEEYTNAGLIMDTSGSVGQREKEILASEMTNILEDYNIRLHVLYCDTKAYTENIQVFSRDDLRNGKLKLDVKGGGGTKMRPAFDWYRENMEELNFEVVICMTDMELWDWGSLGPEPPFSVYWAMLPGARDKKPDWGTKIQIVIDEQK
jgi:predicted metal-dependent peptidase